jgi:hypothetical protein
MGHCIQQTNVSDRYATDATDIVCDEQTVL